MASPGLRDSAVLQLAEIGMPGSAFSVIFAIGRMVNGVICDRVPPRRMIAGELFLGGTANLLFSFFPPFPALFFLWSVNALAQSML